MKARQMWRARHFISRIHAADLVTVTANPDVVVRLVEIANACLSTRRVPPEDLRFALGFVRLSDVPQEDEAWIRGVTRYAHAYDEGEGTSGVPVQMELW